MLTWFLQLIGLRRAPADRFRPEYLAVHMAAVNVPPRRRARR
jgi:hypothetical protein